MKKLIVSSRESRQKGFFNTLLEVTRVRSSSASGGESRSLALCTDLEGFTSTV